ncbi:MAG: ISSpo3, transposase [Microgenomates group bacterium Gr01-1014_5]|nr:MAG: ISSpo3, transposase [Microgenomates group bacterium Gr01-1014_5]
MKEYFSLGTFLKTYKDDEACLDHIKEIKYPAGVFCEKCQKITNFTKIKDRPVYQWSCGYQISPLAGTIFAKTTTPLQFWFYAVFIMTQTRSGVSAKQLQRELGVTYKTSWRMFKQIRILMANANKGGEPLDGIVEIDETYIGGRIKRKGVWAGGITIGNIR